MSPVALITGASRGIGRGIALELARAGRHDLVINYAGNEAAALRMLASFAKKRARRVAAKRRVEIVQGGYFHRRRPRADDRIRRAEISAGSICS